MKIRTQLLLLVFAAGFFCFILYHFLWIHKWHVYELLQESPVAKHQLLPYPADDFFLRLRREALKYNVPESEDDAEGSKAIEPFFDVADEYTSIHIYGLEDGLYRAGSMPSFYDGGSHALFDNLYQWTDGHGETRYDLPVEFKNGYAQVLITFMHPTFFLAPYFFFCFGLCILLFFSILLLFINRKMNTVILLKQRILRMASGDLSTPLPELMQDEIGILARELDHLRTALKETITQEQESHSSNQELISALSHDLRTPLTILKGYLEIVRRNPSPDMSDTYLERCFKKTEEIQAITDRIFEYALVYEETKLPSLSPLSSVILYKYLNENADFLRLTGFCVNTTLPEDGRHASDLPLILADEILLKRIFNNLFSNIIKYGDKKEPVNITGAIDPVGLTIILQNTVVSETSGIQSTQIGLKSVRKMLELMDGTAETNASDELFTVTLYLPVYRQ